MKLVSLCLVLHNHQPVGNFGWVFERATAEAYEPMLAFLESRPKFRVGLHYSGPLLEWLRGSRPDFLARVRALVARRQVEILGGGYYELILPAIPETDQLGQLAAMRERAQALCGTFPAGVWIAERVWEPHLPSVLARGAALDHLWRAQCNCPYWRGVFGGSYLPHIRGANWHHAVAADALVAADAPDAAGAATTVEVADVDFDGAEERLIEARAHVLDVLTRREEPYHAALREAAARGEIVEASDGAENIHAEHVRVKERGLESALAYDARRCLTLTERLIEAEAQFAGAAGEGSVIAADFGAVPFNVTVRDAAAGIIAMTAATSGLRLRKTLTIAAGEPRWSVT